MNMTLSDGAGQSVPARQKPAFYASEKKRRWARDLFEHGYGYTKVASILELSENTVRDWQREYRKGRFRVQIADNQLRYSDELREKVLKMRAEGVSWRKISELTRVPVSTVRKWCAKAVASEKCAAALDPKGEDYCFTALTASVPAIRPNVMVSEMELPPKRFLPCTPPVTSPAAKSPLIGCPFVLMTRVLPSIVKPPM